MNINNGENVVLNNPNYREDQQKILDGIFTLPLEKCGYEIVKIVGENRNFKGNKRFETENGVYSNSKKYDLEVTENGIMTLKQVRSNTKKLSEESDFFTKLLIKVMPKFDFVEEYYIIDIVSDTAFNAKMLWGGGSPNSRSNAESESDVIIWPKRKTLGEFALDGNNGTIIVNNIREVNFKIANLTEKLNDSQIDLMNQFAVMHEAGHKYQNKKGEIKSKRDPKMYLLANLLSKMPILSNFISDEKMDIMENQKDLIRTEERNASAFGLAVIRKLKENGIDVTRGLNNQQIRGVVHFGLDSYELAFKNVKGGSIT